MTYSRDYTYRDSTSRQKTADKKKTSPKKIGSPSEVNPRRKSQTKFVTKVGALKPVRRTSDVKPGELGMPMSSIREAIILVKKKKWIELGNREADFDGGASGGADASFTSERDDRERDRDRDRDSNESMDRDQYQYQDSERGSNSPSRADEFRSQHSPKQNSKSNSRSNSPKGDSASPLAAPAPHRGLARYRHYLSSCVSRSSSMIYCL